MKRGCVWILLFFFAAIPGLAGAVKAVCPPDGVGQWSKEAMFLCPQYKGRDYTRDMRIQSPDGEAVVRVGYENWWLEMGGRKMSLPSKESRLAIDDSRVTENAELAWAPDSVTFYLTQSENRAGVQGFYTGVYRVTKDRVVSLLNVNEIVQREFDRRHVCVAYDVRGKRYSEEADISAVKWVNGSDQLLVVAETTYDSECARGYFAGYLVSLSQRKVIQRYSARELMTQWSDVVGDRLKEDFRGLTAEQKDAQP
jgi:hypothetical protein